MSDCTVKSVGTAVLKRSVLECQRGWEEFLDYLLKGLVGIRMSPVGFFPQKKYNRPGPSILNTKGNTYFIP